MGLQWDCGPYKHGWSLTVLREEKVKNRRFMRSRALSCANVASTSVMSSAWALRSTGCSPGGRFVWSSIGNECMPTHGALFFAACR